MNSTVFTGVREKWLYLYKQLKELTEQEVGTFEEHETQSTVLWKHNSTFAELSAKKDCFVIGFASDTVHDDWEPFKVIQTSKNRAAHYFEVSDNSMFPVFAERIAAAYTLTQSNKPRREITEKAVYSTIDEYIALYPDDIQEILQQIRTVIRNAAPDAQEKISYQMPTFWQNENLVHFAVQKNHIGLYPGASGVEAFAGRLTGYKTSKGAIQLPLSQPMPYDLIDEITRFRVNEIISRRTNE